MIVYSSHVSLNNNFGHQREVMLCGEDHAMKYTRAWNRRVHRHFITELPAQCRSEWLSGSTPTAAGEGGHHHLCHHPLPLHRDLPPVWPGAAAATRPCGVPRRQRLADSHLLRRELSPGMPSRAAVASYRGLGLFTSWTPDSYLTNTWQSVSYDIQCQWVISQVIKYTLLDLHPQGLSSCD